MGRLLDVDFARVVSELTKSSLLKHESFFFNVQKCIGSNLLFINNDIDDLHVVIGGTLKTYLVKQASVSITKHIIDVNAIHHMTS